jgi:hypothetical protein
MSILNVNQIQPVGGGNTITVTASDVSASGATITASSFVGNVTSSSTSEFSSGLNVTGGSVGIGTDNPSHELDIESVSPTIELKDSDHNYKFQLTQSGSATYVDFDTDGGGSSSLRIRNAYDEKVRITSTGNVGIGTDTPYTNNSFNSLSIGGSGKYGLIELVKSNGIAGSWIDAYGTNGDGNLRFTTAGTSGAITFWTGGSFTEKVRITSSGFVGIGTTAPQDNARFQNFQTLNRYQSFQSQNGDLAIISDNNNANVAYIKGTGNAPLLKIDEGSSELFSVRPSFGPTSLQGYRVGITSAWKIRGNNSNAELGFEYDTSTTLSDDYIRVAFNDNTGPWAEGDKGITKGTIHLRSKTDDHMGGAITFGASDSGSSNSAMSGIYTRSDGTYGSKMYFATTDSYANGPKNAMTIDHYGRVTTEKQPSFLAYNITTRGQGTNLVFASTYHNTGSHYNTSNGIFTAPVAGHYMFSFALLHDSAATNYARVLFSYNGNYTTQYADTLVTEPGIYTATSATIVFKMNANDTMRLYNEGNAVYGYQYGSFSGHLLG